MAAHGKDTPSTPRSLSGRVVYTSAFLFFLFIAAFYDGSLNAITVREQLSTPPRSFADILSDPSGMLGVLDGSDTVFDLQSSINPLHRRIADRLAFYPTMEAAIADLRGGKLGGVVGPSALLKYHASRGPCDIVTADTPLTQNFWAFALGLDGNKLLRDVFRVGLTNAFETGAITNILGKYMGSACPNTDLASQPSNSDNVNQSLDQFQGIWLAFIIIISMTIPVLVSEFAIYSCRGAKSGVGRLFNEALGLYIHKKELSNGESPFCKNSESVDGEKPLPKASDNADKKAFFNNPIYR